MRKDLTTKSKFLSLVLRHDPGIIGLKLDSQGWIDVGQLLQSAAVHGTLVSHDELQEIVDTNEKRRFELDLSMNRIRANQGHSVSVDLELPSIEPPEELFHGSSVGNRESILEQGLHPAGRQHVHLSEDYGTARMVGSRHGSPVMFVISSGSLYRQGHQFFQSKNGVWLTDSVPSAFVAEHTFKAD